VSNPTKCHSLRGLEVDNLLALLAHLGLLRALEHSRPDWRPRSKWEGPPWTAQLLLEHTAEPLEVAEAAGEGIEAIAARYDADGRRDVKFTRDEYREYARRMRTDAVGARLAAAVTAEWPETKKGTLQAAPLVMMFGQGHQHFFDRLLAVPRGELPSKLQRRKRPPDLRDPQRIFDALFEPWRRIDRDTDSFRWDPEEDQRYALQFDNPSGTGAAPTVPGANRLAALGFLSFPCFARQRNMKTVATLRSRQRRTFLWPVWTLALTIAGVERLFAHPDLERGRFAALETIGVVEIYAAQRIANGKFMNVTRAMPIAERGAQV